MSETTGMERHYEFTAWSVKRKIDINGIAPHRFPDHGLGIVALERHEAGELLLSVPATALWTVYTVSKSLLEKLGNISVHGSLAVDLSLDRDGSKLPWKKILPTKAELFESVPYLWEDDLQSLLPPPAKVLLEKQKKKIQIDWAVALAAFPRLEHEVFLYNWFIVNTRTFYWAAHGTKKPRSRDDCLALNPFADYFNHSDEGCTVKFDAQGFQIYCDRVYSAGEEISISYGSHNNDFLLVEYGFILSENRWDEVQLDHMILPYLSNRQRYHLEEVGFLGNYVLDRDSICHRTDVALRLICTSKKTWLKFVRGEDDGKEDQAKVDQALLEILTTYQGRTESLSAEILGLTVGLPSQRQILAKRWNQINGLLKAATERTKSRN